MTSLSPFAGLTYDARDDDLVRFRESSLDDTVSLTVRSLIDSLDQHREEARHRLSESERDTLAVFARRRVLHARHTRSPRAIGDALDAYALLPQEYDVPWESWFKAALVLGRDSGMNLDDAARRFLTLAAAPSARRARVAFDAVSRITSLAQCHVIEVDTTYGPGLIETTVVRDQGVASWGGITGQPVSLGQFQVAYDPTTNLAQMAVTIADALDASGRVTCSSIRQDQLVGATFDLVTPGSYLDSLGCLNFFADTAPGEPGFSVTVAEVAAEEHDDGTIDAALVSAELANAANALEEQSAFASGPCIVVVSVLPSFDEISGDESVDLTPFLELIHEHLAPG